MAAIKTVARSATVAFAPTHPEVLATATLEGAIDASFSASASLDVFKIDFSRPDSDLDLLSSYSSSEKFNSLSWGTAGAGSEEYPYGLLASGLADGTISVWNPAPLIREDPNTEASLLAKSQKHAGRVRGLEFNVITSNLLASGGDDGDIYIWDLVNPTSPSHFPALRGGGQEHIVDLSWNRKVQQIMATTSNSGVSVVWDLRRQKSILSFTDPNNRRPCAALEWNPEGATQLIVASADDRSPSLQVWDLRNSISPVKELVGHTKGVVAMAWCPIDSALLLSSAKDYRTLCWDTVSGEIICELPISSNWNFDVQWSPRIAGVLSTSSYDGRVNLYNIEACSRMLPSEGHFGGSVGAGASSASMRAPKWLKRPAGVSFGFEGKLVSFGVKKGASVSELNIQSLITEEDLISRSKEFEAAIEDSGSKSSLRDLCERKAQESGSEEKKEVWSFLKVMFEEDARTSLLGHLGFALPAAEDNKVEGDANVEDVNADMTEKLNLHNTLETIGEDLGFLGAPETDVQGDPIDDGADFFNNLSTPKGVLSPQLVPNVEKAAVEESVVLHEEDHEDGLDEKDDCDKAVQHALVIADFKDAVKQCLSENRMADALVVAHVGGPELWEETLAVYLRKHRRPYRKVLAAVVAHDVGKLVNSRPLNAWKETLALLCSYAGSEDWTMLCDALAAKLDAGACTQAALLCYICAANIEELARIWYEDLLLNSSGATFFKDLQDLMEKIVVLALAKGEKRVTPALARLIGSYAELLASQGVITAALDYIGLVPPEESPEVLLMLRDRISSSKQEVKGDTFAYLDNGLYASPVPAISATLRQAADLQAPPESIYPSYPSEQTSYETTQQGMFYRPAPALPDPTQGNSYPAYVPPPQETTYSQPGMFYPTPPPVPDWSQPPPSLHQAPFVPSSVKSFTPVDPPSTGNAMTNPNLISSRGTAMAPPNQFPSTGNAMTHPSQLSMGPGDWNSNAYGFTRPFKSAPTSTPNMMFSGPANPSIVAAPTPRGFMPVSAPRAPLTQQQPGMLTPATQPQSPSSLIPPTNAQPVPTMAAPPVTIQTVETADVPADLKPVVATLSRLYNETTEALGGARANPGKRREIDDNSRKLGGLFARLNTADISHNARAKLIQICQSLDAGDYTTAMQLQVSLTTSDWDECGSWLGPLKRMIKTRQALR